MPFLSCDCYFMHTCSYVALFVDGAGFLSRNLAAITRVLRYFTLIADTIHLVYNTVRILQNVQTALQHNVNAGNYIIEKVKTIFCT